MLRSTNKHMVKVTPTILNLIELSHEFDCFLLELSLGDVKEL